MHLNVRVCQCKPETGARSPVAIVEALVHLRMNYKDTEPSPLQVAGRNSTEAKLVAEAALNEWANDDRSLSVDAGRNHLFC